MTPEQLQKLIAKGDAQFGTFCSGAGVMLLEVPDKKGIIITHMRLHAFADMPNNVEFTNVQTVVARTWHQLRVIGQKGTNTFHTRHKLVQVQETVEGVTTTYVLPEGWTDWDVFLNHEGNVVFELSHYPGFSSFTAANMPVAVKIPLLPQPPSGYGIQGQTDPSPSIPTVATMRRAGVFEVKMFGRATTAAETSNSTTIMQWPITSLSNLATPQFSLTFGQKTIPLLEVQYILYNKNPNETYPPPTQ